MKRTTGRMIIPFIFGFDIFANNINNVDIIFDLLD